MEKNEVGANLARIRKSKGITQKELAEMVGVGDKQISAWEAGRRGISHRSLLKLCNVLGCQPADFYYTSIEPERRKGENTRKRLVVQEVLRAFDTVNNGGQLRLITKIFAALDMPDNNGGKKAA